MNVEMAVLGAPSLMVRTVSVDIKQHRTKLQFFIVQELCERRDGRPGRPVPNGPYGLCGYKATSNKATVFHSSGVV